MTIRLTRVHNAPGHYTFGPYYIRPHYAATYAPRHGSGARLAFYGIEREGTRNTRGTLLERCRTLADVRRYFQFRGCFETED